MSSDKPKSDPPIQECLKVIAEKTGSKPGILVLALMAQAKEHNMDFEELVRTQYETALSQPSPLNGM